MPRVSKGTIFPDKNRAGKIFTHRLPELAKLANVEAELALATKGNPRLSGAWLLVSNWTEESRYSVWGKAECQEMLAAITAGKDGVLPWIKQRW